MISNRTVLIISDSHEQFSLAATLLRDDGYNVVFERDNSRGLKIAKTKSIELIISELAVSDIDGLELCSRVRNDAELRSTPVLLVGDLSIQSSIVADSYQCGAAHYLQKPIDQFKLFKLCRKMVDLDAQDTRLDHSGNIFNAFIENTNDIITMIDADGTILFESPSTNRVLGYKPNELLGKCLFDLVHPADVNEVIAYFSSVHWDYGTSPMLDYRLRQKDGSWKLIESTGKTIIDDRFGSAVVVTSRAMTVKQFSFDTAFQNDVLRTALFDNAATGLAIFSSAGRLIEGNPALMRILDHSENELRGMLLTEFIFSNEAEIDKLALVDLINGKRSHHQFENGYLASNGERVWGRVNIFAIQDKSDQCHFLLVIFDDPVNGNHVRSASYGFDRLFPERFGETGIPDFNRRKFENVLRFEN